MYLRKANLISVPTHACKAHTDRDKKLEFLVSRRHGNKSGPEPYLSYEEERELANYLIECTEIAYPKTKDEVIGIVYKALLKKRGTEFAEDFKGKGWWPRFTTRWPALALRRGDTLAVCCAEAVTATRTSCTD